MFLKEVINMRKKFDIPIKNIVNMDETAIMYNIPFNKTIHKIRQKTITKATQKQEKTRISCILSINAESNILKPYIIFKGSKREDI